MTNVQWFLRLAQRRLAQAERAEVKEEDPDFVKYDIECAVGYLNNAIGILEDDSQITSICQYCGEEAEEDHPAAICIKG